MEPNRPDPNNMSPAEWDIWDLHEAIGIFCNNESMDVSSDNFELSIFGYSVVEHDQNNSLKRPILVPFLTMF